MAGANDLDGYQPVGRRRPRAVVVGGGLAGMAAAHEIARTPHTGEPVDRSAVRADGSGVVLLEAEPVLGGKARSLPDIVGLHGNRVAATDKGYHIFPRWYWDMWRVMAEAGIVAGEEHVGCSRAGCGDPARGSTSGAPTGGEPVDGSRFSCPREAASRDYTLVKIHPDEHVEAVAAAVSARTALSAGTTFAVMMGLIGADTERLDRRTLEDHLLGRWYAGNTTLERVREIVLKALANPSFDASARTTANTFRRWLPVYLDANWRALRGPLQAELVDPFADSLRASGVSIHTGVGVDRIVVRRERSRQGFVVTEIHLADGSAIDTAASAVVLALPHTVLGDVVEWADGVEPPRVSPTATPSQRRDADPATVVRDLSYLEAAPMASLDLYLRELPPVGQDRSAFPDAHFSLIGSQYAITGFAASKLWRREHRDAFPDGAEHLVQFVCSDVGPLTGLEKGDAYRLLRADIGRFIPELAPVGPGDSDAVVEAVLLMNDAPGEQVTRNEAGTWDRRPSADFGMDNAWLAGDFCRCPVDVASMEAAVSSGLLAGRLAGRYSGPGAGDRAGSGIGTSREAAGGGVSSARKSDPDGSGPEPVLGWPGGSNAVWRWVLGAMALVGAALSHVAGFALGLLTLPYVLARRFALHDLEFEPLRRRGRDDLMMWCGPLAIALGIGGGALAWARTDSFDPWNDPYSALAAQGAPGRWILGSACLASYVLLMVFAVPVRRFLPWSRQTTAGLLLAALGYLLFPFVPAGRGGEIGLAHGLAAFAILIGPNWSVLAATSGLHHAEERFGWIERFARRWVWLAGGAIVAMLVLVVFGQVTFPAQVAALVVGNTWFVVMGVFLLRMPGEATTVLGHQPRTVNAYAPAAV